MRPAAVVTGAKEADAEEDAEAPSPFAAFDRPVVVYVYGASSADDDVLRKLEDVVFKDEELSLGMKAFRAVRISPQDAEKDELIREEGKKLPRMLVIDPVKEKIKVLESKRISASSLYRAMKKAAKASYDVNLDKIVKKHRKILNEQDKLTGEMKVLRDKENRLAEKGDSAKKKLEDVREEIQELEKELQGLAEEQTKLWTLREEEKAAA